MRRCTLTAATTLSALSVLAGACTSAGSPGPSHPMPRDVRVLGRHFEEWHADLDALVPPAEWREEVDATARRVENLDANETLVELMRLAALPGATSGGDGHSGIFPLDDHERGLHLLPLRLYSFPKGFYVVDAPGRPDLVGARVVSVEGTTAEELIELVMPLVPRDNAWTMLARLPQYAVVSEVLDGLGVAEGTGPVDVELELDGATLTETLEPIAANEYADATGTWHPMIPPSLPAGGDALYLRRASEEWWSAYLPREHVVFVQYNQTVGDSFPLGRRIVRLVRRHDSRGVVLDLRHNPGGENAASEGLAQALTHRTLRGIPFAVLVGRGTFSAAGNLALRLQRRTGVVFVGEPTGFSTAFFGDPVAETLPGTGLVVNAGGVEWDVSGRGAYYAPLRPDVELTANAGHYFAGRDPVLEAALRILRRD